MPDPFVVVAVLVVGAVGCFVCIGATRSLILGFVAACVLAPWPLYLDADLPIHYGITTGVLVPTTYLVAALTARAFLPRASLVPAVVRFTPVAMAVYLALGMGLMWERNSQQWSGAVFLIVVVLCLRVGVSVAEWVAADPGHARWWSRLLSAVFVVEVAACILQTAGRAVSIYPEVHLFVAEGRAIGTFNHPSTLGKVALIVAMVQFPLTASQDRPTRRTAWFTIVLAIVATGLTGARANGAALIAMCLIWLILQSRFRSSLARRAGVLVVVAAAAVPVVVAAIERFAVDSSGGDRGYLLAVGLRQFLADPWGGTGPNYFVEVVGRSDALVASGYPVHNIFVLAGAELGILGAVLLFAPLFTAGFAAVIAFRARDERWLWAVAVIAALPGTFAIALTGWGLLASSTVLLWFFAIGFALRYLTNGASVTDETAARARQEPVRSGTAASPSTKPLTSRTVRT